MQTATLHIKVSPEFAGSLKKIASRRGESMGKMIEEGFYYPVTSISQIE